MSSVTENRNSKISKLIPSLIDRFDSQSSEKSATEPGKSRTSRENYKMEQRDFSKRPNIPGMDWADCSWADPEDSLYPDNTD